MCPCPPAQGASPSEAVAGLGLRPRASDYTVSVVGEDNLDLGGISRREQDPHRVRRLDVDLLWSHHSVVEAVTRRPPDAHLFYSVGHRDWHIENRVVVDVVETEVLPY